MLLPVISVVGIDLNTHPTPTSCTHPCNSSILTPVEGELDQKQQDSKDDLLASYSLYIHVAVVVSLPRSYAHSMNSSFSNAVAFTSEISCGGGSVTESGKIKPVSPPYVLEISSFNVLEPLNRSEVSPTVM